MSGGIKSGLIFALAALVVVAGISFIPTVGVLCCGPLGALLLGGLAGYVGVRWSGPAAGMGQGVLAGGLAGVGALLGSLLFFVIALAIVRATPELNDMLRQQMEEAMRQQGGAGLTEEELGLFLSLGSGLAGVCLGLLNLVFALGAGALGGWLAVRQARGSQPPAPPPIAMPPPV
jgi:hypothetical protein